MDDTRKRPGRAADSDIVVFTLFIAEFRIAQRVQVGYKLFCWFNSHLGGAMQRIHILENAIQPYAWGSYTAIPELLGRPSSATPQAELWMGAHPKAPSMAAVDGRLESLKTLIDKYPGEILGRKVAAAFKGELPYLFKVLAAARPLSLQAHPSATQARNGFLRENELEIPLDSPERNYRDSNHKPECICALTPFWALHGFRRIADIIALAGRLQIERMEPLLQILRDQPDSGGLKTFFRTMLTLPPTDKNRLTKQAFDRAHHNITENDAYRWIVALMESYPEDIGVLSPLFLNLVLLQPGQALYLPAAELHAYLEGVGVELMANSDNVLRGGLTPKHIDVAELLAVLDFEERTPRVLSQRPGAGGEFIYECPAKEFTLSVISVSQKTPYSSPKERSVEILLCTTGSARISNLGNGEVTALNKGIAVLVPAAVSAYVLSGNATVYKAAVPV